MAKATTMKQREAKAAAPMLTGTAMDGGSASIGAVKRAWKNAQTGSAYATAKATARNPGMQRHIPGLPEHWVRCALKLSTPLPAARDKPLRRHGETRE